MQSRRDIVVQEFAHHLPFTIVSTLIAMAAVWWFGTQQLESGEAQHLFTQSRSLFHLFHPLHVCLSAIATTSLCWHYKHSLFYAMGIGAVGTIVPCGLSDYFFPYLGGTISGQAMNFHVCLIDHPLIFFPFLVLGILGGIFAEEHLTGSSVFSHAAHVFISSIASLLYLISFGFTAWIADIRYIVPAFAIIVLAVWVPCCISDIVIPAGTAHPSDLKAG